MRKEVIFAVIFGVILGGIILFGINLANNSVNNTAALSQSPAVTPNTTPTPEISTAKNFSIILPEDHSVTSETTTTLRGTAEPGSTVAIITELNDLLVDVAADGTFTSSINLSSGVNHIKAVQAGSDKTTKSVSITVIQSDTIPE